MHTTYTVTQDQSTDKTPKNTLKKEYVSHMPLILRRHDSQPVAVSSPLGFLPLWQCVRRACSQLFARTESVTSLMRSLASNSRGSVLILSNSFLIGLKSNPFHNVSSFARLTLKLLSDTVIPLMPWVLCVITSPEVIEDVSVTVAWWVAVAAATPYRNPSPNTNDDV